MDRALHERIAKAAYDLYEKKGRRNGNQEEDWLEAEKIVRTQLAAEAAAKKAQKSMAETQKTAVKKATLSEKGKKAAKTPARTTISRKKPSPEATI